MSGEQSRVLVEEQAALRRVATLVARGVPAEDLFAAVTDEVGQLLPVEFAIMGRYEADGTITCVGAWGAAAARFTVGSRSKLEGDNLVTMVLATSRPARVDQFAHASGPIGVAGRNSGFHSAVGTPIVVEGRPWGVMTVGCTLLAPPLPEDTETRLASFTELVATAIANAETQAGLTRLAEEQAALRRVATLVARGAAPGQVFAAVTEEVGRLLSVEYAHLGRYEPDRTVTFLAASGRIDAVLPAGTRLRLGEKNVSTRVFETRRAARIDSYADAAGLPAVAARERGVRSSVGTPIIVDDSLWGVMVVGSAREPPMPPDTEARLASFTELVATALANAETHSGLTRLAEEQAALRRLATLVARGLPPEAVFAAVTEMIGKLLGVEYAFMGRYEPDGPFAVVAAWGTADDRAPVGSRWSLGGKNLVTIVYETARSARMDNFGKASGPLGVAAQQTGVRSAAGTPITVEGRLWGVVVAGSTLEQALPRDIEARLGSFTELVATAIANAESRAELTGSRARIVAAADESRRRIERDLHDGAQQRLVHAVIVLKLALRALANGDSNPGELVAEALRQAEQANSELRELAHGILPAALTRGGLRAGVEALLSRVSLPVSVDVSVERVPAGVEATAYFVISEALTNVIKHAHAGRASVMARVERGELRVEVRDDGVGGALGGHGTGLEGLEDRVAALDGLLVLDSPPGEGTRVCALLPVSEEDQPSGASRK
jgi:GAF domain-containing protein